MFLLVASTHKNTGVAGGLLKGGLFVHTGMLYTEDKGCTRIDDNGPRLTGASSFMVLAHAEPVPTNKKAQGHRPAPHKMGIAHIVIIRTCVSAVSLVPFVDELRIVPRDFLQPIILFTMMVMSNLCKSIPQACESDVSRPALLHEDMGAMRRQRCSKGTCFQWSQEGRTLTFAPSSAQLNSGLMTLSIWVLRACSTFVSPHRGSCYS